MLEKEKQHFSFKNFIYQVIFIRLAVLIGKVLPRQWGLKIASLVGQIAGSIQSNPTVKALQANQSVIHNQSLSSKELKTKSRTILSSASKCMFDYFYFLSRPEKLDQVIDYSPEAQDACDRIRNNQPTVFACPHTSNFDLMGYALATQGLNLQVISYPSPNASYKMQNKIRKGLGILVTPMSLSAFRLARKRLSEGKSILTGFDRPLENQQPVKHQLVFFGHQAHLPAAYVRLAVDAKVPVILLAATSQPGGRYRLVGSNPIWMETGDEIDDEISYNANRVLRESEGLIKKFADQWAMFYPIWPQFTDPKKVKKGK
jgi:lauroyl/myristoyl acyltransferase